MDGDKYTIGVIGAGNLAFSLVPALNGSGHQVKQIISRNKTAAMDLAKQSKADSHTRISDLLPELDIVFLTVPDSAIPVIARDLDWFKGILVHTSGSVSLESIMSGKGARGVFYPLQTFNRNRKVEFENVPIFIEGSGQTVLSDIKGIAESLSARAYEMDSAKRAELHLAAVFANNFSNYILLSSYRIAEKSDIPPELMKNLIKETFGKALENGPVASQTGPAFRGDKTTIEKHLKLLSCSPELSDIYQCLTD